MENTDEIQGFPDTEWPKFLSYKLASQYLSDVWGWPVKVTTLRTWRSTNTYGMREVFTKMGSKTVADRQQLDELVNNMLKENGDR